MTPKTRDVFISYSQEDKVTADTICAALESAGIRCWIAPRDVQPGRSFPGEITRAIQASKIMVLVFSAHSNQSEQVLREVQLAVDSHLHLIQLRIADVPASDDLKYFLGTPHWLDALTPPLKRHLERLTNSARALLEVETPTPTSAPANLPAATVPAPANLPTASVPPAATVNGKRFRPIIVIVAVALFASGIWLVARGLGSLRHQRSTIAQTTTSVPSPTNLPTTTAPAPSVSASAASEDPNIKEAQNYIQRARDRSKRQDLDGALADLNRALELDPKNSSAYNDRGVVKKYKHDPDAAAADYNKALELNPKNATALNNLGVIKFDRNEMEAAIIYCDRALGIDSTRTGTLILRGDAKTGQEDLKGAIADYDRVLQLDSKNFVATHHRALAQMQGKQWTQAIADLRVLCAARPTSQELFQLLLWIAQSHLPDIGAANRELAQYMQARVPPKGDDWYGQIANFLLDKFTTARFLDPNGEFLKNDVRKHSEAAMFAGMKNLSLGNRDGAKVNFRDCLAQKIYLSFEYQLARAELKSLGK
jgi:tetratricopeptide (TPR) repeat protein